MCIYLMYCELALRASIVGRNGGENNSG